MILALWAALAQATTFALLVNGGDQPDTNYRTHVEHLREVHQTLLDRGIEPQNISVFSADGELSAPDTTIGLEEADSRAWLIEGTPAADLVPSHAVVDTTWEGVSLLPAKNAELGNWFGNAARQLRPGDTLLIYVTDHGLKGTESLEDASIALWRERLSVAEFRVLLQTLHPEVRVMVTMSQCYAGSFAEALYPVESEVPSANRCGWFAAPPDRPSYGCYAEAREQTIGHGFRWSEALGRRSSLADAHDEVLLTDRTPDVPVSSTDVHIERVLRAEARRRAKLPENLVDELLSDSLQSPSQEALEHRAKIHALAASVGAGTPLTLAEVRRIQEPLPAMYDGLLEGARMWHQVLWEARLQNYQDFLADNPRWERRLSRADEWEPEVRAELRTALLDAIDDWTPQPQKERILALNDQYDEARAGAWRTAVREGIVMRMSYLLKRIAAEHLLAEDLEHLAEHKQAMDELTSCETVAPGRIPGHAAALTTPEHDPWPPMVQDLEVLDGVTAPWLGATFGPVSKKRSDHLKLPKGAVALHVVFEGSPAERAGLSAGDILIGPEEQPFDTESSMLEWMLTRPRGEALPMKLWRGYRQYETEVFLASWMAQHVEPPPASETVTDLRLYDLEGLPMPTPEGPYLLFYWATWCGPCKAAAPEVVKWSRETGVPVIAVTDEDLGRISVWRRRYRGAFPTIAVDPFRQSHTALAIEELPTFVHVDSDGTVLATQHGYSKLRGLFP